VVRLTRAYTLVVAGLVAYKVGYAWIGAQRVTAALAGLSVSLALGGAFALNDIYDQESDTINVPTRPLPAAELSARTAWWIAIGCDLLAVVAALEAGEPEMVMLTIGLIVVLIAYSEGLKKIPGIKNLIMAVVGGSVPVFGSLSGGRMARMTWWLALVIGLFILQKEMAADVVDRKGDERVGLRTLPVMVGAPMTMVLVSVINLAFVFTVVASEGFASVWIPGTRVLITLGGVNCLSALVVAGWHCDYGATAFLTAQKIILIGGVLLAFAL